MEGGGTYGGKNGGKKEEKAGQGLISQGLSEEMKK